MPGKAAAWSLLLFVHYAVWLGRHAMDVKPVYKGLSSVAGVPLFRKGPVPTVFLSIPPVLNRQSSGFTVIVIRASRCRPEMNHREVELKVCENVVLRLCSLASKTSPHRCLLIPSPRRHSLCILECILHYRRPPFIRHMGAGAPRNIFMATTRLGRILQVVR